MTLTPPKQRCIIPVRSHEANINVRERRFSFGACRSIESAPSRLRPGAGESTVSSGGAIPHAALGQYVWKPSQADRVSTANNAKNDAASPKREADKGTRHWARDRTAGRNRAMKKRLVSLVAVMVAVAVAVAGQASLGLAQGTWETKASMAQARISFGGTAHNGLIYVTGGYPSATCNYLNSLEAYDTANNSWSTKTSMPTGREAPGVAALGGIIYAVGGGTGCGVFTNVVEAYDPTVGAGGTWTTKTSMSKQRIGLSVAVVGGLLYAIGGDRDPATSFQTTPTMEAYDSTVGTGGSWSFKAAPPWANSTVVGAQAVNGKIYAVTTSVSTRPVDVYIYSPADDAWRIGTPAPLVQYGGPGVAALGGRIYLLGGDQWDSPQSSPSLRPPHR